MKQVKVTLTHLTQLYLKYHFNINKSVYKALINYITIFLLPNISVQTSCMDMFQTRGPGATTLDRTGLVRLVLQSLEGGQCAGRGPEGT